MAFEEALTEVTGVLRWLQALGVLLLGYVIFEIITFYINIKRYRELMKIKDDMKRIEKKIDKLGKK
jgi:biopolymer transport protein ExbB/TolQ